MSSSPPPSTTTGCLAVLHPDLLSLILGRLDLVDFVRCRAVCRLWRSVARRPNPQPPWLMLSSSSAANPQSRHFYSLTDRRTYEIRLPQIAGHHCVGSTGGSLISVDAYARLHVTNPLTGAHFPLPGPTALPNLEAAVRDPASGLVTAYLFWADGVHTSPCTRYSLYHMRTRYFHRAIVACPSSDDVVTVFIIHGKHGDIAFVRPWDPSWTALKSPIRFFKDLIFHKGRLLAVDSAGRLAIFDPAPRPSRFISPRRLAEMQDDDNAEQKHYLVESPDGNDLFLIYQEMKTDEGEDELELLFLAALTRTVGFQVLRLDESECVWREVADVGDFALFLGFNQPAWVPVRGSSPAELRRNCIYFTDDASEDTRVCDLGDGSISNLDIDLRQLSLSPTAIWYTHVHHQR